MLEMKLDTTATVGAVGCDPINVFPYQKTRQLRDRPLILNGSAPEAESEKLWFSDLLTFGLRFFQHRSPSCAADAKAVVIQEQQLWWVREFERFDDDPFTRDAERAALRRDQREKNRRALSFRTLAFVAALKSFRSWNF